MKDTKIRWAEHTWNPMTGCTKISPGCDNCYAETIALKFGAPAFPNGFTPTFKPGKLTQLRKLKPGRVFVNSMSDVFHPDFTRQQIDEVFDEMAAQAQHDYLVLTKRPALMRNYMIGREGWLSRRGIAKVPTQIWLGTTIESDQYVWRADHLRDIPVDVRFLSCEPLIGPLPSLDLTGIHWVIVGGESGKGFRPMPHEWAVDLRDRCEAADVAFFFKQSAAPRTEMGMELEGRLHEEYPFPHPADHPPHEGRTVGRYTGRHSQETLALL
jgi:protein gp37